MVKWLSPAGQIKDMPHNQITLTVGFLYRNRAIRYKHLTALRRHPGKQYGHFPDLSAEGMTQLHLPMHQMDFILLPLLPSQTHLFISKIAV